MTWTPPTEPRIVDDGPSSNGQAHGYSRTSIELAALMADPTPPYEWVAAGLLERGDRLVLTGGEGGGKSTLLRQIAVRLAVGEDPFTGAPIDRPQQVLSIDLENSTRQLAREYRRLYDMCADRYVPGCFDVEVRPQGIDLGRASDQAWLRDCVDDHGPDVLVVGPVYKLAVADADKESTARVAVEQLDRLRAEHGCVVLMEAHSPHADDDAKARNLRPINSSLWLRWPEFGFGLDKTGRLVRWRGDRDGARRWPAKLRRGDDDDWPWVVDEDAQADVDNWQGHTACQNAILDVMGAGAAGATYTGAQVVRLLRERGNGFQDATVYKALGELRDAGLVSAAPGRRGSNSWTLVPGGQS